MVLTIMKRRKKIGRNAKETAARGTNEKHEVRVRAARLADAARIADLSTQLGYPVSPRVMAALIKRVSKRKNQKLFAATLRGNVVGWLEIFRPVSVLNSGKTEIGALVVDDQVRRSGVGTALMRVAHAWARAHGSPFVYLRSNVIRKDAHRFYERTGYSIFKTQYVFRKTLTDRKSKVR